MFDPDRRERALAKAESDAREDRLHRRRSLVLPTIVVLLFALAGVAFVFMILRGNFGSPQAGFATSGLEDRAAESANQPSDAAGDARAAEAAPPAEPAAKTPPRPRLTTPRPPQPEPADAAPPAVSPFADQNNQRLLPDGEQATNPAATASLAPTPPARTPAGAPDRPQTGEPSASSAPAAEAATEPAGLSEVDQQVASALRESITADEAIVPAPAATRPLHQALEQAPPPMADAPNGKVAFLVDMSGSLIDTLPDVITWLNGRLAELPPDRQFTIIFFRDGTSTEVPPAGLRPATDATRGSAKRWMRPSSANIAAHGRSDATEAIELALSYGVGEICILSDDAFGRRAGSTGRAAIIDRIRTTIGDRRVQIHATQFFYEDADQTLEVLTEEFGGRYEFIPPGRETNEPAINLLDPLSHAEN